MSFLLLSRPSRRLPWIVTALLLLLGTGTAAYAFWASSTSSSNAAATADTLSPGSKPAVTAAGSALTVTWAGGTTVNGRAATGYTVARYSAATGGTAVPATGGCAGTVTTLTCTEQSVPGGIWYYTVTPAIALWTGAESPRSNGISSDSTAPVATVSGISPMPNAAGWNYTSPVSVTVTADDGPAGSGVASISYALDGGAQQTVSGAVAVVPVSGDGTHTLTYFATDKVGNAGSAKSQTVRIDTQAPAAPVFTPTPGSVYSGNVGAVPLTGTAEAGSKVTLVASDAGSAHSVPATVTASGTGTWSASLDLTSLNQGAVTYSATVTDAAGNTSPAKTATATKDTVAPAAAQGLSVPTYINNAATQTANSANASAVPVSGTAEVNGTVTVKATDPANNSVSGTVVASGPSGAWSLNLNLGSSSSMVDGIITYTVTVTDAAGNTSAAATAADTRDTAAPALKLDTLQNILSGNAANYPVSGSNDSNTPVSVSVTDGATTVRGTASGMGWSTGPLNLTSLKDTSTASPTVTVTVIATTSDAAGNTTTLTSTVTKDVVRPAVTNIAISGTAGRKAATPDPGDTITITFSERIDPAKACTGWSGTSLNGTATLTEAGTNDQMTFASSNCPNLLGTLSLGGNYIGQGSAVFGGNGNGNATTFVFDTTGQILTIKLGNQQSNPNGTPISATPTVPPTLAPLASLADLAGNPAGSSQVIWGTSGF
ncbi:beta strand repeat-containing protein [Arthrobacter sp. MMS24-T111]